MKVCQLCGDIYKDHVDFCFNDGEILVADAAVTSPLMAHVELDAPLPRRVQGGQSAPAAVPGPAPSGPAPVPAAAAAAAAAATGTASAGWPEVVPVPRPQPTPQAPEPTTQGSTPKPAIVRSTDITLPPDTTPPAVTEPVNRDNAGTPARPAANPVDAPLGAPAGLSELANGPVDIDDSAEAPTETEEAPAPNEAPTIPPVLPPSAVPTPVTPEARESLRVTPSNDRPVSSGAAGTHGVVASDTDMPSIRPPLDRGQTPAPLSPPRPTSALPAQVRMGGGAAIAVDAIGEGSNWLMIGAVFAVGVLFSVMGAGAVLAGMLYTGAPWREVEEPVTRHDPPAPVTAPVTPNAVEELVVDPQPDLPQPMEVPSSIQVPVPAPVPAPMPTDRVVALTPAPAPAPAAAVPASVQKHKVLLRANGEASVKNAVTGVLFAQRTPYTAELAPGDYKLLYEPTQGTAKPIEKNCTVPGPNVTRDDGVTDCSIALAFDPPVPVVPESAPRLVKTLFLGMTGELTVDDRILGQTNLSYDMEVGDHDCSVKTESDTLVGTCVVGEPDPKSGRFTLNLLEQGLVRKPPTVP